MKERPILFQGAMVRALLAGTKTQTRREIKHRVGSRVWQEQRPNGSMGWTTNLGHAFGNTTALTCPYGQPGDRLWVRETWGYRGARFDGATPDLQDVYIRYRADDPQPGLPRSITCKRGEYDHNLPKQRERQKSESYDDYEDYLNRYWQQWRPGIHMPRWACRLVLEVTGVRVERLQEISEADAIAEGCITEEIVSGYDGSTIKVPAEIPHPSGIGAQGWDTATDWYADLWESINGDGSWDANPWVWVVEFRKAPL